MSSTRLTIYAITIALAGGLGGLVAQPASSPPELEVLLLDYKSKVSQLVETHLSKAREELSQGYIKALERMQQDATLRGMLEEAMAIKAEKEAVEANHEQSLPVLPRGLRELPAMRRKYLDAQQSLRMSLQRRLEPLQRELVRQMDVLAVRLAREGRSDAALEVRQLAKTCSEKNAFIGGTWEDHTRRVTPRPDDLPIHLSKGASVSTEARLKPPVEIELVVKVEGLDLRLGYAADQVIFNWQSKPDELRVDGGPADKTYTPKQGELPKGKFVVILWYVGKDRQTIKVDGSLRFDHRGDYSDIDRPLSIVAFGSEAKVQSIKTRRPLLP